MPHTGYDITLYRPELKLQVVNLLQYLWGGDPDRNLPYFEWKYDNNPYSGSPLGIAALHEGRVVGFRGYFANRFKLCEKNEPFVVLSPGDTCVHPDHWRKGLSVAMGKAAMDEYAKECRMFLNMTCSKASLPGYQSMGFFPLAKKAYLSQHSILGLTKCIVSARSISPPEMKRITLGRFDHILVSDKPRPSEMRSVVVGQDRKGLGIELFQDEDFFRWRFGNPRNRYVYYYRMEGTRTLGYVVLGVSPNHRRGYILDFAEMGSQAIGEILGYIVRARHFDILSIYSFCVNDMLLKTLQGLGFKINSLARILERKLHGELPLLIRPVKETFTDRDFFIGEIDTRKIEHWSLKPICSDAA